MRLIMCFLRPYEETDVKRIAEEDLQALESVIESLFVFTLIWSIGCTGDYDGRVKFDSYLKDKIKEISPSVNFPSEGTIYEYEFNIQTKSFIKWSDRNTGF